MKAAFFEAPYKVNVHEAPRPEPGAHEVVVRVAACGICGTDQHIFQGDFFPTYPLIGGHEIAGEVVAIGDNVDNVTEGERVAVDPMVFCGYCFFCQRDQGNHCLHWIGMGVTRAGGFAEYVLAPKGNIYPISDMSYEEAAFVEPISCVVYALRRLKIPVGSNALIYGAGTIGLLMAQLVKHSGAGQVVSVDLKEEKLALARRFGAETVTGGEGADDILREMSPLGFDVVIDCTGVPTVVEHMFTQVRNEGKLLFFGVNPTGATIKVNPYDVYQKDLEIYGTFAQRYTFHQAVELMRGGAVDVKPLLSDLMSIEQFPEALKLAGSGEVFKVQIQPLS